MWRKQPPNVTRLPNRLLNHCQRGQHKHALVLSYTSKINSRLYLHSLSLSLSRVPWFHCLSFHLPDLTSRFPPVSMDSRRSALSLHKPPTAPSVWGHLRMLPRISTHPFCLIFSSVFLYLTDQSIDSLFFPPFVTCFSLSLILFPHFRRPGRQHVGVYCTVQFYCIFVLISQTNANSSFFTWHLFSTSLLQRWWFQQLFKMLSA